MFAWFNSERRLSKDYEVNPRHSENMVRIVLLKKTFGRLGPIA